MGSGVDGWELQACGVGSGVQHLGLRDAKGMRAS